MADNLDPQGFGDNLDPNIPADAGAGAGSGSNVATLTSWKESLGTDIKNSPFIQKFEDTPEGLNQAFESHGNLEKLLGHEKVPIPKGDDDVEGWNRFSKAMGIPDKAEQYGLGEYEVPESMKGMAIDKNKFSEVAHAHKLTPAQTKGLWKVYNEINIEGYNNAMKSHQSNLDTVINTLRSEWGDAYDSNIELGQMVINKFSSDQETSDFLMASLAKDPKGIKFLAKIGDQFAENKIGEFQIKRFTLAPEQAQEEILKITRDMNHPYNNPKATDKEHEEAINYVNSLYMTVNKAKG